MYEIIEILLYEKKQTIDKVLHGHLKKLRFFP